jgi:hypothetical protein
MRVNSSDLPDQLGWSKRKSQKSEFVFAKTGGRQPASDPFETPKGFFFRELNEWLLLPVSGIFGRFSLVSDWNRGISLPGSFNGLADPSAPSLPR